MNDEQLIRICAAADVPNGQGRSFKISSVHLAIFHSNGAFYATGDICSHEHEHLADGWVDGEIVECPRHGAQFSLTNGNALSLPATEPIEVFEVKLQNGDVWAVIPNVYLEA
jgi:3-phenylpropionate/trans-cinnamate dioxygenase ferredoxin component